MQKRFPNEAKKRRRRFAAKARKKAQLGQPGHQLQGVACGSKSQLRRSLGGCFLGREIGLGLISGGSAHGGRIIDAFSHS